MRRGDGGGGDPLSAHVAATQRGEADVDSGLRQRSAVRLNGRPVSRGCGRGGGVVRGW
jgi:hypothetical protein